jgi:2-amino-4-hydroxy-6-hydroxymethyldihydropteridine diphosphokinase
VVRISKPKRAYIGIGSNLGDRLKHCTTAVEKISGLPGCVLSGVSPWYRTQPVGVEGQGWYLNGVAAVEAEIPARELLKNLLAIEAQMGRVRKERWEARTIDLDILLFGSDVIDEEGLIIPHPHMHLRRFALVPLAQLDPALIHPVLGIRVGALLERLPEAGQEVSPWKHG